MKVVILSDIHDHVHYLSEALNFVKSYKELIICGDLCSPFVLDLVTNQFAGSVHMVLGNNDGDLYRISQKISQRIKLCGEFLELIEINDQLIERKNFEQLYKLDYFDKEHGTTRIAVSHFPEIAKAISPSGLYDLICYGHNHQYAVRKQNGSILLNPGSIMGYLPSQKCHVLPSFAIFDTVTREIEQLEINFSNDNGKYTYEVLEKEKIA